jgi:hypothetical protein
VGAPFYPTHSPPSSYYYYYFYSPTTPGPPAKKKDRNEGLQWRGLVSTGFEQTNGRIIISFPSVETNTRQQPSSLSLEFII